jgi:hypothetical protein
MGLFEGLALRTEAGLHDGATRLVAGWRPQYSLGPEPFNGPWSLEEEPTCLCTSITVTTADVT